MRDLFVHIGTHKTGSTAIQSALYENQARLEAEGIVLIPPPPPDLDLMRIQAPDPTVARAFAEHVADTARRHPGPAVRFVMSWEGFSGDPLGGYKNAGAIAECVAKACDGLNPQVVVYLRRQDDFCESLYTQQIHGGQSHTFDEFLRRYDASAFNWALLLGAYADRFDRSKIIARRYHRRFLPAPDSILRDFGAIINSRVVAEHAPTESPNAGYSRDSLEVARLVNPHLTDDEKRRMRAILQRVGAKRPFENYSFFGPGERAAFLRRYADSNAAVAKTYFDDPSGELFPAPDPAAEPPPYQGLTTEAVAVLLTRAVLHVQRTGQAATPAPAPPPPERSVVLNAVRKTERALVYVVSLIPGAKPALKYVARKLGLLGR